MDINKFAPKFQTFFTETANTVAERQIRAA
jgi:hypothetical protein